MCHRVESIVLSDTIFQFFNTGFTDLLRASALFCDHGQHGSDALINVRQQQLVRTPNLFYTTVPPDPNS